jgi:hypothetical protein
MVYGNGNAMLMLNLDVPEQWTSLDRRLSLSDADNTYNTMSRIKSCCGCQCPGPSTSPGKGRREGGG